MAEKLCAKATNLRGCIKALKLDGVLSPRQVLVCIGSLLFSESDLDGFSLDSKLYLKWSVLFFYHVVFEPGAWGMEKQCYQELLLAEQYLLQQDKKSPLNWSRVQFLLTAVEVGNFLTFGNGVQRARAHCTMVLKQLDIINHLKYSAEGHTEIVIRLEFMAYIFHVVQDFEHFEKIRSIWNSAPSTKHEKPLPELKEMVWEGFTADILRNSLRKSVQHVSFHILNQNLNFSRGVAVFNFDTDVDFHL